MIIAYAIKFTNVPSSSIALSLDHARALQYAADRGGVVVELVEKAAILRKFDAYVPADVASSMRCRIRELEVQVDELRSSAATGEAALHDGCVTAGRCTATPACPGGTCARAARPLTDQPRVVTDPAAIDAGG